MTHLPNHKNQNLQQKQKLNPLMKMKIKLQRTPHKTTIHDVQHENNQSNDNKMLQNKGIIIKKKTYKLVIHDIQLEKS